MSRRAKGLMTKFLTTMLVVALAAPAMADVPGPGPHHGRPFERPEPPPRADTVPITIRVDPQAKESVLKIPKQFLPSAKLGAIEEQQPAGTGSMRHVFAAIALSAAITGLFFVRRDQRTRTAVVIVVCLCAVAAAGSLMANAPAPAPVPDRPNPSQPDPASNPPVAPPNQNGAPAALLNGVDGKVRIEVTDGGTAVTLIVSGKLAKDSGLSTTDRTSAPAVAAPAPTAAPNAPSP